MSNELLKRISDGDLSAVNTETIKNQLGMYLLAEAQTQLQANVKLIDVLNILQDKYIAKSMQYIEENDDETAIEYLPKMIENITNCLNTSNNIIRSVVDNKEIQNLMIINQDNRQINLNGDKDETKVALEDPVSREKVREAVSKILAFVETEVNNSEINTAEFTDIDNGGGN